jgi:hypothetical protein
MQVLVDTTYTKYITCRCNYFLLQESSSVYLILVVGMIIVMTVRELYFITCKGRNPKGLSVQILFCLLYVGWLSSIVWCS